MDTVLDDETREIYKAEIEALIQSDEKFITVSPDELDAILEAFDFTLKNGREKVRAQMLYDLIRIKKEK